MIGGICDVIYSQGTTETQEKELVSSGGIWKIIRKNTFFPRAVQVIHTSAIPDFRTHAVALWETVQHKSVGPPFDSAVKRL